MSKVPYLFVIVVFLGANLTAAPVFAQSLSKEQVRTRILDKCVYELWPKRAESGGVVDICSCAAKTLITEMSAEEIARYNPERRMNRSLRARYGAALEICA